MPKIVLAESEVDLKQATELRPALISIDQVAHYLGVARSTVYKVFLQHLEVIKLGKRSLVVLASVDALVSRLRRRDAA